MTFPDERQPPSGSAHTSNVEVGASGQPVGYRNPPTRTQFQKGKSGNPGGRPQNPPPLDYDNILVSVMESIHGGKSFIELMIEVQVEQALLANTQSYKILQEGYVAAKQRQRHSKNDRVAEQQAAERLVKSINDFIAQTTCPESAAPSAAGKTAARDE